MIFTHFGPCCASARSYRAAGLRDKPSRALSAGHPLSLWERVRVRTDRADERARIVRRLERHAPRACYLAVTARIANARRLGRDAITSKVSSRRQEFVA